MGTLLAAERWLLFDAPECRGKLRYSEAVIVAVVFLLETHVSVRKVDRRVLAIDIDENLGLITCVWDRTGQKARRFTSEWSGRGVQHHSREWRKRGSG